MQPAAEPPDAVLADDETVERLRRAVTTDAVVWGDDEPEDDPAVAVLLAVLRDVVASTPVEVAPLAKVLPLRRRPVLVRGSAVAACALGLLTVGGVAAASPGSPLYGVRTAVTSAVSSVVHAVTPSGPAAAPGRSRPALQPRTTHPPRPASGPTRHPTTSVLGGLPTPATTPAPTAPLAVAPPLAAAPAPTATLPAAPARGRTAAPAPARTVEAARLVAALLDRAQAHLTAGRFIPAGQLLDLAERRLPDVALQDGRAELAARLGALRAIEAAGRPGRPKVHPTGPPASPRVTRPAAGTGWAPAGKDPKATPPVTPAPAQPGGTAPDRPKPHPTGRP